MRKYLNRARKYENIHKALNRIIKDNEKEIIAMNRDQMYEDGIVDVKNNLQWDYQPSTIRQKRRSAKYKKTDFITLRWTGSFYDKMFLIIKDKEFIISSKDFKWDKFKSGKWGEGRFKNALGLTEKNMNELRQLVREDLILGFKNAIQNA